MEPSRPPTGSPLFSLRLVVLSTVAGLAALFGVLAIMGFTFTRTETLWIALPLVLGFADVVLVPAVGTTVRPIPYGVSPEDARRISVRVLHTVTFLRFALAEAPALFGLAASIVAQSMLPYAIGFLFAVPLLSLFVYPRERVVNEVRDRLESGGAASHLWEGLRSANRPAPR